MIQNIVVEPAGVIEQITMNDFLRRVYVGSPEQVFYATPESTIVVHVVELGSEQPGSGETLKTALFFARQQINVVTGEVAAK